MMTELVNIRDYVENVIIDLRYGTENNFTGQVIYDFSDALLRKGTALRLRRASLYLSELGYRLKIWDAYRPVSAQLRLWEVYPDPRFVADPINGHSNHSRGSAVDLTLTDKEGNELLMPTGFDDFSSRAGRTYEGISDEARRNALLLEDAMKKAGFIPYPEEWWHFNDKDLYDVVDQDKKKGDKAMGEVLQVIRERRSIRKFTEGRISRDDLAVIAEAGAWAPTGKNTQSFQLTILDDTEEIQSLAKEIGKALGNEKYDFYRPQAFILCSNLKIEEGGTNMVADTGCVLENIFLQAKSMGIGSCWINQLKELSDVPAIREKLRSYGIPDEHIVWGCAALGYAKEEPKAPERRATVKFAD